ncbi:MAG: 4-(cytidine 5'-diphospho)-2-C-methyl-D-erythritol kinase [Candidatus Omnitrophica bacterium]|nr:4-(cytidine 5'-diphospho)-2-C-methyl-D-erythritol kinase [Candidatus Omnitrophota bacterium]
MNKLKLFSPAKLNLFLKVVNKRPDGYHNIETLFQRISLGDEIVLTKNAQGRISVTCDHPDVPLDMRNLVYKVADLLKRDLNVKWGVKIDIKKRIPVAAGLAGGSGNAATVIKGLNQLWDLKLEQKQQIEYGRQIGSDVAFFLYDTPWALGTGRGDIIRKLNIKNKLWYVIITPCIKLYTPEIYQGLNLPLTNKNVDVSILIQNLKYNRLETLKSLLVNDLETVILKVSPRLQAIKENLGLFDIKGVLISGSGPSVYAVVEDQAKAREIAQRFSKRFKQVFVAHTL